MKTIIFRIVTRPNSAFRKTVLLTLICLPFHCALAADTPTQSNKTLPNGGQLIVKSSSSHDPFWGETLYKHEYSYLAPSGVTENIGGSSCLNSAVDGNPDIIFAHKLMFLPLKCHAAFIVRTVKNGWRYYSFGKNEYEKYPLWVKSKVRLDDKYDGPSEIISIDAKKRTVAVEYLTYKTNVITFRLSENGEKMDMIGLERRIGPNQDPAQEIKRLTDKSQIPIVRAAAATFLGSIEEPKAVEALINALSDDGLNVRPSAIEALGRIGDKRATTPLLQILENKQENKYTRSYAAKALGGIKDSRAVQPLIAALSDNALELRCASAEALGEIGDRRALEPLVKKSQQRFREKWPVRRCAVEGLGHFRDQQSINALKNILNAFFENREVKTAARTSLEKIQNTEKSR